MDMQPVGRWRAMDAQTNERSIDRSKGCIFRAGAEAGAIARGVVRARVSIRTDRTPPRERLRIGVRRSGCYGPPAQAAQGSARRAACPDQQEPPQRSNRPICPEAVRCSRTVQHQNRFEGIPH
eukprot:scaffold175_cov414-Prasinococcus_capsulatus_cf.AAC.47